MDRRKFKNWLLQLLMLIVIATVALFLFCEQCRDFPPSIYRSWMISFVVWVVLWKGNEFITIYFQKYFSWIRTPVKTMAVMALASAVFTGLAMAGLLIFFGWLYGFDPSGIMQRNIVSGILIAMFIGTFMHGRKFLLSWRQLAVNQERLKSENLIAKYQSLKDQVNPHFLFNNLNTLTGLVYQDADKAAKFIKQLSEVYRYVLETRDQEVVDLFTELKFLDSYIYLQKIRFGDNLKIEVEITGSNNVKVAPLSLQMLVENAVKHNTISEKEPLNVAIRLENEEYIVVQNDINRKNIIPTASPGIGLNNIKARYEFLTDKLVQIIQSDQYFTVKLPILTDR